MTKSLYFGSKMIGVFSGDGAASFGRGGCPYDRHPEQRQIPATVISTMANVLIIDDDILICKLIERIVRPLGHEARYACTLKEGLESVYRESFDVVFLDVRLPDGNGLHVLSEFREAPSAPGVIIITGIGDPDGAELAIKSGAWDYIQKPFSVQAIALPLARLLQYREERAVRKPSKVLKREDIIGDSPEMIACLELLSSAAGTDVNVLITGETGTGKEVFSKTIHKNSRRADKSFVVVDCAALPDTLVESLLFGHRKGAFTGADSDREGLIAQADGGTLFLDEVGELPLSVQKAFLRILQERRFRPLGAGKEITSDFRLISATNRNLDHMVQTGKLREDLLFRLRTIMIEVPPLRKRDRDIKKLAMIFMANICDRYGIGTKGFSPDLLEALLAYHWPGNVRELQSALEEAIAVARNEPTLFPVHLPTHIRIKLVRASVVALPLKPIPDENSIQSPDAFPRLRSLIEETERQYLRDLMSVTRGDIKEACTVSGLSRARIYARLKKYEIPRRADHTAGADG